MEKIDDSHIPEDVLIRYAFDGIPEKAIDVTNHLIACDSCHEVFEHHQNLKTALERAKTLESERVPARRTSWFVLPKPVWAAAAALVAVFCLSPLVQQPSAAIQTVNVVAVRGDQAVSARSDVPVNLKLDTTGLDVPSPFQVSVVNDRGRSVWQGAAHQVGSEWQVQTDRGFRRGRYWVRIPDPAHDGEVMREFQLDVK